MIKVNAPFLFALFIIIFFLVIRWIEWYAFQEGKRKLRKSGKGSVKESKDTAMKNIAEDKSWPVRLKELLSFGRADLKRPWYLGIPWGVFIFVNTLISDYFKQTYQWILYFCLVCGLLGGFEIWMMLKNNKTFFSLQDHKKRYFKSQFAQLLVSLIFVAIFAGGFFYYVDAKKCDPISVRESVEWAIEPIYESNWPHFTEGLVPVGKDGKTGFITKEGRIVIPFRYDDADNFYEGLAAVMMDGKWGYIQRNGNVVLPFVYDEAIGFSDGIAPVKKGETWMVIDRSGKVLFRTNYKYITQFHEGVAKVEVRDKKYKKKFTENLIDEKGRLLFHKEYERMDQFNEGCVPVWDRDTSSFCFIDKKEQRTVPQEFLDATGFKNGYAEVTLKSGEGALIDHNGNILKMLREEDPFRDCYFLFQEGLISFSEGEWSSGFSGGGDFKYGFKDMQGKVVIPANFRDVAESSDGMIGIQVNGLWGFVENPLPEAARAVNPEFWQHDKTQIAMVEGIPVYAGELERCAYDLKQNPSDPTSSIPYKEAFEKIKAEKAYEKYGKNVDPETIQYQIGNEYYERFIIHSNSYQNLF